MESKSATNVRNNVSRVLRQEGIRLIFYAKTEDDADILLAKIDTKFFAVLCLSEGQKPTVLQIEAIEAIRHAGGIAVVATPENWDMVRGFIRDIKAS